ncbi:MAG TPA: ABC-F family ATP-binding cassette domain-containing protein [Myxococcales bacterium]|nr:ABC-F family ATP-binding cassette domain-containing protein [Myxococcales bacterium]
MTLLRAAGVSLSFGSRAIFRGLSLVIEEGERVGLIGVNGSGKSSLMRILAGAAQPDAGTLQTRRGARITWLPQEPTFTPGATPESELSAGNPLHEARAMLDRLGVKDWDRPIDELSGGARKRVAVARALLTRPDLLMLDEPTNHLDADTVDWLEEELDGLSGALLLVTHDRYFLDDLVDRIVELQPGEGLVSYPGNYEAYLEQRAIAQEQAEQQQHKRERWIAQEVAWLRRGVEARRTKSRSRIERARRLIAEKGLAPARTAALQTAAAPRLGHTVLEARAVAKAWGGRRVVDGVSLIVQRGERIGIVGRNGAGKTTFLRMLLGELAPDSGEVIAGKNTRIAYYDQQRAQLDPEWTVYESALGERIAGDVRRSEDFVELGGRRVALRDYLEDLLFPVPMQKMLVRALSGGERNRLLLARLFLRGANLLALDEPTNDLDLVTLNVLERLLLEFGGSVLLVTHDRYFLDKVATGILAFDEAGHAIRYPGNYETYLALRQEKAAPAAAPQKVAREKPPAPRKPGKLTFKEQRELESMEALIEAAEARRQEAERALADPRTYGETPQQVPALQRQLDESAAEVDRLYARWQHLQDLLTTA